MATLRDELTHQPTELSFGTSGLRGLVSDMTDLECYINTLGFTRFLQAKDGLGEGETVYIAGDLRDSTHRILGAVTRALYDSGLGLVVANCGLVPTPTVAYFALQHGAPCVMVTGSHIPADRNGIKFYKRSGEVLKVDESDIKAAVATVRAEVYAQDSATSPFNSQGMLRQAVDVPGPTEDAAQAFLGRYVDAFGGAALSGLDLVFYQHSAVGRDLLVDVLEKLGATVTPVGRSDKFIPIDSENVTAANQAYFRQLIAEHPGSFAVVSTDGDSDRPFVVDEHGDFHRGDVLGTVVATWLKADFVAYPISSSDAADTYLAGKHIATEHTRIGSPYVIAAMQAAHQAGKKRITSWEVNGGFLVGSDMLLAQGELKALPTRDAILPIIVALIAAREAGSVSRLFADLPARYTEAGLIDNFPAAVSMAILQRYADDTAQNRTELGSYFSSDYGFSAVASINSLDGIRITFTNGDIAHLRPSGNAPQLRIYSVANSPERAAEIMELALAEPDGIFRSIEAALSSGRTRS